MAQRRPPLPCRRALARRIAALRAPVRLSAWRWSTWLWTDLRRWTRRGWRPCARPGARCGSRGCSYGSPVSGRWRRSGSGRSRGAFDPPGVTRGFGWLGDLLAAPAARWDSAWYLVIAHYGYRPELGSYTSARDAFFPLYPLGLHALSDLGLPAGAGRRAVLAGGVRLALYWPPPPDHAGAGRVRASRQRRHRRSGGARDGARADGVLLLGRLLRVAVPRAVGRAVPVRAPRALGVDGRARDARGRDAQHRPGARCCRR